MSVTDDFERQLRDELRAIEQTPAPTGLAERLISTTPERAAGRTVRPFRSRTMFAPLLAAAAVVAVIVAVAAAISLGRDNRTAPVAPVPVHPTTSAPTPTHTATPSPAPTSEQVDVAVGDARVRLTVPKGWHRAASQPPVCCGTAPTVCLVRGTGNYSDGASCVLTVTVQPRSGQLGISPDYPRPIDRACGSWTTTAHSEVPIQGRPGEYRRFHNGCTGTDSELWATMSKPQVVFWHPITSASTHTTVAHLVDTAVLPTITDSARQFDEGRIVGMEHRADGYYVRIRRALITLDGSVIDEDATPYVYRLGGEITTTGGTDPCGGIQPCDLAAVYAQYRRGSRPAAGTAVVGAYVELDRAATGVQPMFLVPRKLN